MYIIDKIRKITAGGADYSIECSGVKEAMETAFASIKDNGTAVIAGNLRYGEKISIDPFDLIKGKRILGTWGGETQPERDIPLYADSFLKGKLRLEKLITHTYTLDEINRSLKDLEDGNVVRALIDMDTV